MHNFVRACNIVLGVVNIALFGFWLVLIRVDLIHAEPNGGKYVLDYLSLQVTVLETVFAFVGIVLAVLGFFGYNLVVERAERRADSAARKVVAELYERGELDGPQQRSSTAANLPKARAVDTKNAAKEEEEL